MDWLELIVGGSAGVYVTWRYMRNKTNEMVDNPFAETCKDVKDDAVWCGKKAYGFVVGCKNTVYRICGKEVCSDL